MSQEVRVFCPATVSNVGPGFDLLGFALEAPGDTMILRKNDLGRLRLIDRSGCGLPLEADRNIAAIAARALLEKSKAGEGFDLIFEAKIKPGSGIGSSAASCVAAVVGINELLGAPFATEELLPYAMEGEVFASGSYHADNIAPALLGGFTLIRGYEPLDIKHIPYPSDLWCAVVHPNLEFKTSEGRKILPKEIPLSRTVAQAGNLAGLVAGLITSDYGLIRRSVTDHIAEPVRSNRLPGFAELKEKTLAGGALGTGLSGSGPSVFCLCRGEDMATTMARQMKVHFDAQNIESAIYVSRVSQAGCRITG